MRYLNCQCFKGLLPIQPLNLTDKKKAENYVVILAEKVIIN